jgi:hypothetical protein
MLQCLKSGRWFVAQDQRVGERCLHTLGRILLSNPTEYYRQVTVQRQPHVQDKGVAAPALSMSRAARNVEHDRC